MLRATTCSKTVFVLLIYYLRFYSFITWKFFNYDNYCIQKINNNAVAAQSEENFSCYHGFQSGQPKSPLGFADKYKLGLMVTKVKSYAVFKYLVKLIIIIRYSISMVRLKIFLKIHYHNMH